MNNNLREDTIAEFDKALCALILVFMSMQAVDLRRLVKIVRQYEVIYGGGISTSDAAVREECELLVGILESELGLRKPVVSRRLHHDGTLPSLVDIKKKPRGEGFPKPTIARATALAKLGAGAGKLNAESPKAKKAAKAVEPGREAKKNPQPEKKVEKKTEAKAAAKKGPKQKAQKRPITEKQGREAELAKTPIKAVQQAKVDEDDVYKDVRSRHLSALKASAERANQTAGHAEDDSEPETKRQFAALHLFDAFQKNKLPKYGGFIVCMRFVDDTGYTVIEIIGYENMQDIYPDGQTLVFKSVGCKLFAIVEPAAYLLKSVEPVNRPAEQTIPYRFSELARITTKRFQNVFVGRKPVFMPTSFSVFKPSGEDLAVLFYDQAEVYANIQDFIIMILRDRLRLPAPDSRKAAEIIARGIREFRLWMDEA